MKKAGSVVLSLMLFAGLAAAGATQAYAVGDKIGYVDLSKVFDDY